MSDSGFMKKESADLTVTRRRLGAALLATVAAASAIIATPLPAYAGQTIFFPLRWCAVEGSRAADSPTTVPNPAGGFEPDTDGVLWRRHERATDVHWTPGANISFRSAFTAAAMDQGSFPIIADPRPPSAGGLGQEGDVVYASGNNELSDTLAACRSAWNNLDVSLGTHFPGPVVVNVRKLLNADGTDSNAVGVSCTGCLVTTSLAQVCTDMTQANPPGVAVNEMTAYTVVWDNEWTVLPHGSPPAPGDTLLAHELGHTLFLGHGNGLDDDNDGYFDGCDRDSGYGAVSLPGETSNTPNTLMGPSGGSGITSLQSRVARAVAFGSAGATMDPPGSLISGPTVADERVDRVHDVDDPGIDLVSAGITRESQNEINTISHALFGLIKGEAATSYATFVDTDNDSTTGGQPADLGFNTRFEGAELVTVVVTDGKKRAVTRARVWLFEDGTFNEVKAKRIAAFIRTARPTHPEGAPGLFDAVDILLPVDVGDLSGPAARLEALAERRGTGEFDRLPDGDKSGVLTLTPPQFPFCQADPTDPGGTTTVKAEGLVPDRGAHVILGDVNVGQGAINGDGNVDVTFDVPTDTKIGPHLVTVGVDETAITADCIIQVGKRGDEGAGGRRGWLIWLVIIGVFLVLLLGWWLARRAIKT